MITLRKTDKPLHKMNRVELLTTADLYDELSHSMRALGANTSSDRFGALSSVCLNEYDRRNR